MKQASQQDINAAVAYYNTFKNGCCPCGGELAAFGFGVVIPRILASNPRARTDRLSDGMREGAAEVVCLYSLGHGLTPVGKLLHNNPLRKHARRIFAWLPLA